MILQVLQARRKMILTKTSDIRDRWNFLKKDPQPPRNWFYPVGQYSTSLPVSLDQCFGSRVRDFLCLRDCKILPKLCIVRLWQWCASHAFSDENLHHFIHKEPNSVMVIECLWLSCWNYKRGLKVPTRCTLIHRVKRVSM